MEHMKKNLDFNPFIIIFFFTVFFSCTKKEINNINIKKNIVRPSKFIIDFEINNNSDTLIKKYGPALMLELDILNRSGETLFFKEENFRGNIEYVVNDYKFITSLEDRLYDFEVYPGEIRKKTLIIRENLNYKSLKDLKDNYKLLNTENYNIIFPSSLNEFKYSFIFDRISFKEIIKEYYFNKKRVNESDKEFYISLDSFYIKPINYQEIVEDVIPVVDSLQ